MDASRATTRSMGCSAARAPPASSRARNRPAAAAAAPVPLVSSAWRVPSNAAQVRAQRQWRRCMASVCSAHRAGSSTPRRCARCAQVGNTSRSPRPTAVWCCASRATSTINLGSRRSCLASVAQSASIKTKQAAGFARSARRASTQHPTERRASSVRRGRSARQSPPWPASFVLLAGMARAVRKTRSAVGSVPWADMESRGVPTVPARLSADLDDMAPGARQTRCARESAQQGATGNRARSVPGAPALALVASTATLVLNAVPHVRGASTALPLRWRAPRNAHQECKAMKGCANTGARLGPGGRLQPAVATSRPPLSASRAPKESLASVTANVHHAVPGDMATAVRLTVDARDSARQGGLGPPAPVLRRALVVAALEDMDSLEP